MSLTSWFFMLAPILMFAIFDSFLPVKKNVIWTLALTITLALVSHFVFDAFDEMYFVEIALMIVFGLIAIRMESSRYFKLQPTAVGIIIACYFAYFQWAGTPVFVRLLPLAAKMTPELAAAQNDPYTLTLLSNLSFQSIFIFLFQAGLVAYAGIYLKNRHWVLARLSIYPLLFGAAILNRVLNAPM